MRIFTKLSEEIVTLFRQHDWYNKESESNTPWGLPEITCRRCGKSYPTPMEYIDITWNYGCRGEKQLLINQLEADNEK